MPFHKAKKPILSVPTKTLCLAALFGFFAMSGAGCVEKVGSFGRPCKSDVDCWDKIPCLDNYCGGRPRDGSTSNDGGTAKTEASPAEKVRQEKVPQEANPLPDWVPAGIQACTKDEDCEDNQACVKIDDKSSACLIISFKNTTFCSKGDECGPLQECITYRGIPVCLQRCLRDVDCPKPPRVCCYSKQAAARYCRPALIACLP